ncbi:hypothetical protein [Azonexus sp.]|uniref:hypothetical protein n=1 Tax=Azonexus sp. TaxID=1872668 RepID=UPI0035AF06A4
MRRLQQWFDLIAGVSAAEQQRLERARAIFSARGPDVAALQLPACWRRRVRVAG